MIRELATSNGKTPIEIAKIVAGDAGILASPAGHRPGEGRGPGSGDAGRGQDGA
jgi:hypothetical protein